MLLPTPTTATLTCSIIYAPPSRWPRRARQCRCIESIYRQDTHNSLNVASQANSSPPLEGRGLLAEGGEVDAVGEAPAAALVPARVAATALTGGGTSPFAAR